MKQLQDSKPGNSLTGENILEIIATFFIAAVIIALSVRIVFF